MTFATVFFLLAWAIALWYTCSRVGSRPSVTLLLLSGLLAIHGPPMLVYLHLTGPDTFIYEVVLHTVDADEVFTTMLLSLGLMFVGVMTGVALARALARHAGLWLPPVDEPDTAVRQTYDVGPAHVAALWVVTAAMLAIIVVEGQPAKILQYFLSASTEMDQTMLRVEGGGTSLYAYNVFLYSVAPFVVMVLWCAQRLDRANPRWLLLLALFGAVFIGKLGTLSKAPPVFFLLQLALLAAILSAGSRIRIRDVVLLGALVFTLFSFVVSLTFPELELPGILRFLYYRGFDIPNEALLEYFAAFPSAFPHNWEYGPFGPLHRPSGEDPLPNYFAVAELSRGSILSSSNVMFLGDAWADWSWLGVLAFPVAAGVLVQGVDLYAARNGRTDEWACITAGCSFSVFTMLTTALTTALVTGGLLLIPLASRLFARRGAMSATAVSPAPPRPAP